jgi:hypothetical protein
LDFIAFMDLPLSIQKKMQTGSVPTDEEENVKNAKIDEQTGLLCILIFYKGIMVKFLDD